MAAPDAENTEKAMKMAQQEMDYRVDLYNRFAANYTSAYFNTTSSTQSTDATVHLCYRMVASCYDKCMEKRWDGKSPSCCCSLLEGVAWCIHWHLLKHLVLQV